MAICVFCGSAATLSGEHVLPRWLSRVGLDMQPAPHGAGALNRIGRDLGVRPPFRQTVRDVCRTCNQGWMSRLEVVAQRVLTPFIRGESGALEPPDQPAIATWLHKTALVAMLVSSEEERSRGHGVPAAEYDDLYANRDQMRPLTATQCWIGRYNGDYAWSVRVTPLVVAVDGLPEPNGPQGYAMTVLLGQLALIGVRFTTPSLQIDLATRHGLPQLWPTRSRVAWPDGELVDDADRLAFVTGRQLRSLEPHVEIRPWREATELPASELVDDMVELPTICGRHVAHYPAALVAEAGDGRFYAFVVSCDCGVAYLVHTEPDGAHCKAAETPEVVRALYDANLGQEVEFAITGRYGRFVCRRLA